MSSSTCAFICCGSQRVRDLEQAVGERALAVVDVRDDAEVADVRHAAIAQKDHPRRKTRAEAASAARPRAERIELDVEVPEVGVDVGVERARRPRARRAASVAGRLVSRSL